MKIEEADRGTFVESTIKFFSRLKDRTDDFQDLIGKYSGEEKHPEISKKRLNLLLTIKWNSWDYPLEKHVHNHRQAYNDLMECSACIEYSVPGVEKRLEHLIDSINCAEITLQVDACVIRTNTDNRRECFEVASSFFIEFHPSHLSSRRAGRNSDVSTVCFKDRDGSSGVER